MTGIGGWAFKLNDVILSSCGDFDLCNDSEATIIDGLTANPDTGLPALRTEDVTYAQRDGVRHFNDWYEPRIITLVGVVGPDVPEDCVAGECTTVREQVLALLQAWKRTCCDTELVAYPPCYEGPDGFGEGGFGEGPFGDPVDNTLTGPYGIVGRPRVAQAKPRFNNEHIYDVLLRFDAVDQRVYLLDGCGTPGYERCTNIYPENNAGYVCLSDGELCSPVCATEHVGPVVDPTVVEVGGTETVYPTVTLWPNLTNPIVENVTTLEYITFAGTVTGFPVIINTEDMTATQNGESVTHLLAGSLSFTMSPGEFSVRLLTTSDTDTGHMSLCVRDTLVSF